ncbi:hypothetical protein [Neobacillus mesonae]|uniref:Spore coat protein n=1 Tax=Neobacillus mesonae TaxID=1193713 RepID=A0A3T0HS43_9BACI|nr:hypothetical protein [Neobacillus mesonae]AZU59950.1 hypothetical protein CHR53_00885 [Neobacillus mesonae]MED4207100.1 hypothetical protein [Neobacillus mesonae]
MGKKSKQNGISNQVISSIVNDVFAKNGINPDEVKISDQKKKEIKALVSDLSKQVKEFVSKEDKKMKKDKDK